MSRPPRFPFSAVVGHDDAKLALVLAAVAPEIGGVLLRGQKGSAKTTLARGVAALLPGEAPFADLPLGATEDRVVGTLDLAAALRGGERRFEPGLLFVANGGVLYVDEVNLLADHLVDVLLDVAVSGVNRVEREGISHEHPSRFVLVGSMNPEEGELRPQLLDRFGLAVDVASSLDPDERALAVERRMAFDADPVSFAASFRAEEERWRAEIAGARPATVPTALLRRISALCASMAVDGLRADLVIARAAAARAGLARRAEADNDDVRAVAHLALAHRQRRSPFDQPGVAEEHLDQALDDALGSEGGDGDAPERHADPDAPAAPPTLSFAANQDAGGRRSMATGPRGRLVVTRPHQPGDPVALAATARATGQRRMATDDPLAPPDLRGAVREQKAGNLVVLAVDASGSMGAQQRMEAAKGAVLGLLLDAYQRRDRVAVVCFRGDGAEVVLRPTGAVEVARARLSDLPTGGRTPLAAGIDAALKVATTAGPAATHRPLLVVITDGRATSGPPGVDPLDAALAAAERVRRQGIAAVVVDAETSEPGAARLGLAATLAAALGARHIPIAELDADALRHPL